MLQITLTALLGFVASNAPGILTGVLGTKMTSWIAAHLKTKTRQIAYRDIVLPLFQSLTALLQSVPVPPFKGGRRKVTGRS